VPTVRTDPSGNGEKTDPRPRTQPQPSTYCTGEVNILIVDDDPAICRLIQAALANDQFTIDAVSEPGEVRARLEARPHHLIILDYVLPGLSAEEVLEWIRVAQPEASIIVVTAFPSVDSALNCLRARTYDYITKPFQPAHLQRVVHRCLESKGLLRLQEDALKAAVGAVIRERRKALGLTLKDLAVRSDVSLGYLSQIELGKNSASIETLYKISLGLEVRMADLFRQIQPEA
jgi:CheY-like chemotaxis protein/DNA-binding XRE family transcriptional regulator